MFKIEIIGGVVHIFDAGQKTHKVFFSYDYVDEKAGRVQFDSAHVYDISRFSNDDFTDGKTFITYLKANSVFGGSGGGGGTVNITTLSKEAKQDDEIVELQAILAKIIAAPATNATPDFDIVTAAGTVAAGAIHFSIANTGGADGTVGGKTLPSGTVLDFVPLPLGQKYGALAYDSTGTTYLIIEAR